jgi:hypothetical protein
MAGMRQGTSPVRSQQNRARRAVMLRRSSPLIAHLAISPGHAPNESPLKLPRLSRHLYTPKSTGY